MPRRSVAKCSRCGLLLLLHVMVIATLRRLMLSSSLTTQRQAQARGKRKAKELEDMEVSLQAAAAEVRRSMEAKATERANKYLENPDGKAWLATISGPVRATPQAQAHSGDR